MKKGLLMLIAFTVFFAFTAANAADAKPRGGLKSPKQSFTSTPSKSSDTGSASSGTKSGSTAASGANTKPGFFSGGSLMKGLMIGGLAGLLFGSMFGGMGFFGNFLGLIVNLLALFVLFAAIRSVFVYFRNRRKADQRRPY
ncbi:membrane protein [Paenibacillus beijingensis]|uniref:Membrane protein n=1 Tax=Paenibacillus beijingensis TaxID=1126833 RepID=A0A0D5NQ21_9BACL|nr:membrane protein [Paenibacillus beijingensis]AJY77097.1 membrane protein [Paenibacillus beijingensis]